MGLSLDIVANDIAKVQLYHPETREPIGTMIIAGPDHESTRAWKREINDRRQKRNYKENTDAEIRESLCRRIVGWEGVKSTDTGEDAPFDSNALPKLVKQDWFISQIMLAMGEEDFFFRK